MATVIYLKDRAPPKARATDPEANMQSGGAKVLLYTGVRYERYQPDQKPRPTSSPRARKR